MGERKVLNKYYPPDFDPEKLVKRYRPREKQDNVRMMMPMTVRCNICNHYAYIGTKFNMRKETVHDEDYLGIKIYRFYFKCVQCYGEITFKTDPKNHDYVVEKGAIRNYEPWRDAMAAQETLRELRVNEEEGNTMKFLENKTYDSKREMEIMDALEEIKSLNKRKSGITYQQMVQALFDLQLKELEKDEIDDEKVVKEMLGIKKVKRIDDSKEIVDETKELAIELYENKANKIQIEKSEKLFPKIKISVKPKGTQNSVSENNNNLFNYSSDSE